MQDHATRLPIPISRAAPCRMFCCHRLVALICLVAPCIASAASPVPGSQTPTLTLESLPRPSAPPAEAGPVVPAQVKRWREEATSYEYGEGVPRDPVRAAQLYCRAARYGDAHAQYALGWMLTNARGIERDDAAAAYMFAAAAEQGMEQARNMAARLGTPRGAPPPCLRPPEADKATARGNDGKGGKGGRPVAYARPAWAYGLPGSLGPPPNAPEPIVRFVNLIAPDYKLAPQLVLAVMAAESNFDPLAVSPKNAQGLMQLMPGTATRFKVRKIEDPAQNIQGGMAYLRWLLAYFEGDLTLVLAAYNAGEGAVERYQGVPPYAETRNYVQRILARLDGQRLHPFDPAVTAPSSALRTARGTTVAR